MRPLPLLVVSFIAFGVACVLGWASGLVSVESVPNWMMALTSIALVIYAAMTVEEGKKNRRKDTVEKMLENLYSPVYEMLSRAVKLVRDGVIRPGVDFALIDTGQIRKTIDKFGHYMDSYEKGALSDLIEAIEEQGASVNVTPECVSLITKSFYDRLSHVRLRREQLMQELQGVNSTKHTRSRDQ